MSDWGGGQDHTTSGHMLNLVAGKEEGDAREQDAGLKGAQRSKQ